MTDVYKSDILQTVMQQVSDEPELPTLFMRTVRLCPLLSLALLL
jgi:hypothetical protein